MKRTDIKTVSLFAIILLLLSIFLGGALAYFGFISSVVYSYLISIVGTVASIVGLLSLLVPKITSKDIRSIEADLIEQVAIAAKSASEYEVLISQNKEQLESVKRERKEIELLVKQVSLRIFLQERLRNIIFLIGTLTNENKQLLDLINEYNDLNKKIEEIGGDAEKSSHAEIISSIIREHELLKRKVMKEDAEISVSLGPFSAKLKPFRAMEDALSVLFLR